jgi:hypothetical protein
MTFLKKYILVKTGRSITQRREAIAILKIPV